MPIEKPSINSEDYLTEDSETAQPKVGTTVQAGWDAVDTFLKSDGGDFPTDFRFTEEPALVKFLSSSPFAVYEQHWIDRPKGKKSFVCLQDDCPLCDILGDKPRTKAAFSVLVLTGETVGVQILTAPPSFMRQLRKAHEDERKGPLNREFWAISRSGSAAKTVYTLDFVRGRDLEEEWNLDLDQVKEQIAAAVPFTAEVIYQSPRSEMLEVARSVA